MAKILLHANENILDSSFSSVSPPSCIFFFEENENEEDEDEDKQEDEDEDENENEEKKNNNNALSWDKMSLLYFINE